MSKLADGNIYRLLSEGFPKGPYHQFADLVLNVQSTYNRHPLRMTVDLFAGEHLAQCIIHQLEIEYDDALAVCQLYVDARLLRPAAFKGAAASSGTRFRPDSIYSLSKKGVTAFLDVVERRVGSGKMPPYLIYVKRDPTGKLNLGPSVAEAILKAFAGDKPNASVDEGYETNEVGEDGKAIPVKDRTHFLKKVANTFSGMDGVSWMLNRTAVNSREEACLAWNQMMSLGWVAGLGGDEKSFKDGKTAHYQLSPLALTIVRWDDTDASNHPAGLQMSSGLTRISTENIEKFDNFLFSNNVLTKPDTDEIVGSNESIPMNGGNHIFTRSRSKSKRPSSALFSSESRKSTTTRSLSVGPSPTDPAVAAKSNDGRKVDMLATHEEGHQGRARAATVNGPPGAASFYSKGRTPVLAGDFGSKDSCGARLNVILQTPVALMAFREFLQSSYCVENLLFWLDVEAFKSGYGQAGPAGPADGEKHSESENPAGVKSMLVPHAIAIYLKFIRDDSPFQVNLGANTKLTLKDIVEVANPHFGQISASSLTSASLLDVDTLVPSNVRSHFPTEMDGVDSNMYDAAAQHVFRLMSTDSIPKFWQTDQARQLLGLDIDVANGRSHEGASEYVDSH